MDAQKLKHGALVAAGVGGIGLVAYVLYGRLSAASSTSDSSTDSTGAGDTAFSALSTGVSTGGQYAGGSVSTDDGVGASGSTSDAAAPTSPAASVMDYATILAGLFSGATNATAQQQSAAAANNAAVVSAVNTVAPTPPPLPVVSQPAPAAPAPAPTPAAAVTPGLNDFSESVNGRLTYNPTLYATDAAYRADWDQGASNSVAAFGSNWNSVAAGANQSVLNQGLAGAYAGYVQQTSGQ